MQTFDRNTPGTGIFPQSPGIFHRSPNIFPRSPDIFHRSPGIFPRSPGIFPRSLDIFPPVTHYLPPVTRYLPPITWYLPPGHPVSSPGHPVSSPWSPGIFPASPHQPVLHPILTISKNSQNCSNWLVIKSVFLFACNMHRFRIAYFCRNLAPRSPQSDPSPWEGNLGTRFLVKKGKKIPLEQCSCGLFVNLVALP